MNSILNDKYIESQPLEVLSSSSQLNISQEQLMNTITAILSSRDKKDLLILEYILKININEKRSVRVEDLMAYINMSNPSISVRLKKLRELSIHGTEFPLLKTIKNGNALFYYFTDLIDHEKALKKVELILSRQGFSYEKYAAEKGIRVKRVWDSSDTTDANNVGEVDDEYHCEVDEDAEEFAEEVDEEMEKTSEYLSSENKTIGEVNFDELSERTVTMGEVLEMLDETSNALIENVTEAFTEIVNEKITELNNRIVELEKKLSSSQNYNNTQESTEELLARARLLVRQKIFAKKDK